MQPMTRVDLPDMLADSYIMQAVGPTTSNIAPLGVIWDKVERSYKSYWKPTKEELEHLINGGYVELSILGVQPPVRVSVKDLPIFNPKDLDIPAQSSFDLGDN